MSNPNKVGRLFTALVLAGLVVLPSTVRAATITCNQEDGDYAPWETVWLTGTGFEPHSDITLTATDNAGGSGVAGISYQLDGGAVQSYCAPFLVGTEGTHALRYWATDYSGNSEAPHDLAVNIDWTPPTVQINFYSLETGEGDAIAPTDAGKSGCQYDSITRIWQYNWQTKKLSPGTYRIRVFSSETQQTDGVFEITLK